MHGMNRKEAAFYLDALRVEFPRLEFPVSMECTQEKREEARGKIMEALEIAIRALDNRAESGREALHEH